MAGVGIGNCSQRFSIICRSRFAVVRRNTAAMMGDYLSRKLFEEQRERFAGSEMKVSTRVRTRVFVREKRTSRKFRVPRDIHQNTQVHLRRQVSTHKHGGGAKDPATWEQK